ncbi:PEP/pyruvate-binding domain-containing protein [Kribbella sp. NPDC026611]|uniref:PEP/pyruvate-binding domain-containing protein n=1 Tax=Kribbella sp. NPDC026611 TaxID=3154911 RepID=UPI0033C3B7B1
MNSEYVVPLEGEVDPAQAGVKNAQLDGIWVPKGFVVTAAAYQEFVRDAGLGPVIAQAVRRYRAGRDVVVAAAEVRSAFRDASVPPAVTREILAAYDELGGEGTDVAVRCSPVSLPDGQQGEVFRHLRTGADVVAACRRCFASLFGSVAFGKREANGEDHLKAVMQVTVQRMIRADLGASGTVRGESTVLRARATWGLGGSPADDAGQYSVHPGARPMIVKHRGAKATKTVYDDRRGRRSYPRPSASGPAWL